MADLKHGDYRPEGLTRNLVAKLRAAVESHREEPVCGKTANREDCLRVQDFGTCPSGTSGVWKHARSKRCT